ncbi:MAG: PAS-domain containing protein [Rhodoferax sp.]
MPSLTVRDLDLLGEGVVLVGEDLRIIGANRRALALLPPGAAELGTPLEDLLRHAGATHAPDAAALLRQADSLPLAPGLVAHRRSEGGLLLCVHAAPEAAQCPMEQPLADALDQLDQGITVFDARLVLVACNRAVQRMLDFPPELCRIGTPFADMVRFNAQRGEYGPGDPLQLSRQRVELARREVAHCFERIRPDGRVIEVRGTPLPGGGFVTIYTDVTARNAAETKLRGSLGALQARVAERTGRLSQREAELAKKTALLEATVDNISQGISLFDGDLRLLVHNRKFLDLLGFPDHLGSEGTPLAEIFRYNAERGEYGPGAVEELVQARLETARHPVAHRFRRERPNGTVLEVQGTPLPAPIGGFVTTYADVTELVRARERAETALAELKRTQEQLVQAEKMASLGQLVAGVAHEINTPVGVALIAASHLEGVSAQIEGLLQANAMKRSDLDRYVGVTRESTRLVLSNLERAAQLIRSFKQVAVDQSSEERRHFHLANYLGALLDSLRPQLRKGAHTITVDCPSDLELDTYPGALSHVLTGLLANALTHAFDAQTPGTLHLDASLQDGDVLLRFTDNGRGIPGEHLGHIFDPFFTTRRSSGSCGLGLHVVYNLVTSSLHGSIRCDSAMGRGTTFTLRFPAHLPASAQEPTPVADAGPDSTG